MDYDPNLTNSGRMAIQTVELTFQLWTYNAKYVVPVGGNCKGLTVIDAAVSNVYDKLESHPNCDEIAVIYLTDDNGQTLESADEDERGEEWLKDMLVSATIIAIEPDPRT